MKRLVLFFLFFFLTVQGYAEEKVYTDSGLKPEPPIYSSSSSPGPQRQLPHYAERRSGVISPGFHARQHTTFPARPIDVTGQVRDTHAFADANGAPPQPVTPVNADSAKLYRTFEAAVADAYARYTLWMLIVTAIPFLLGLVCFVDIVRNEFTGNNKIIWCLVILFLPILGPMSYYFIGTDQKIRPEPDEKAVVHLM
jgi:hypothetical protein